MPEPALYPSSDLHRQPVTRLLVAALACWATLAAGPARGESKLVTISASVTKPLTLRWIQDLDLGSISTAPGTWSGATVSISQTGVVSCANPNIICSGATQPAKYKITGSNRMTVDVSAPDVILTNQSDPSKTLLLEVDAPARVVLTSSGEPGVTFGIGGSITLSSDTPGGVYTGTFNVTADY